jgi:hypothetical protein
VQIADTHFRRQFLFQLLVLLYHLQTFTKEAKATWITPRNRSLQMEFTLEGDAVQWVSDTIVRALEELKQTAPAGRVFADAVVGVLERERNWVRWKNDVCSPFDREPEPGSTLEERTRSKREEMRAEPQEWPQSLGSAPLTEIWEMGYRDLGDLENPFQCVCQRRRSTSVAYVCIFKAWGREGFRKEDQAGRYQDRDAQGRLRAPSRTRRYRACQSGGGRDTHINTWLA